MTAYADASFLVSLYLQDAQSPGARAIVTARANITLTPLGELEVVNAIELAVFRQLIRRHQAQQVLRDFEQDRGGFYALADLPPECYIRAGRLARRHTNRIGARSLDILHVAAALVLRADVFYTFDDRQRRLARAEGLAVLTVKAGTEPGLVQNLCSAGHNAPIELRTQRVWVNLRTRSGRRTSAPHPPRIRSSACVRSFARPKETSGLLSTPGQPRRPPGPCARASAGVPRNLSGRAARRGPALPIFR